MEKDDELKGNGNSYTTLNRLYDARLGRWLSVDPEEDEQPYQSPYCAMDNNPIKNTDPLGDCVICDWNQAIGDGIISGVSDMLSTAGEILTHPDRVLDNITYAIDHPTETYNNIKAGVQQYANDLTSGDPKTAGKAIGEGIVAVGSFFIGAEEVKAATSAIKVKKAEAVVAKTVSPNVKKVLKSMEEIKKEGGTIKVNPKAPKQELNLTIQKGKGKVDVRIETHKVPKKYGGNGTTPQRHMNVDLHPNKKVLPNSGHKIL